MADGIHVEQTPNTGPPLRELWAFVSRDQEGRENTIAGYLPGAGLTQLVTGNPKTFELFKKLAKVCAEEVEGKGQTVHLLRFTRREEVEGWRG